MSKRRTGMSEEVGKDAAVVDATDATGGEVATAGAGGTGTGRVKSRYHRTTCHDDTENPTSFTPY